MAEDKSLPLLFGWWALIMGLVTVILHNVWVAEWRVAITIIGWLSLIRGIVYIGFPEFPQKKVLILKDKPALVQILLIVGVLFGAWLIWMSY